MWLYNQFVRQKRQSSAHLHASPTPLSFPLAKSVVTYGQNNLQPQRTAAQSPCGLSYSCSNAHARNVNTCIHDIKDEDATQALVRSHTPLTTYVSTWASQMKPESLGHSSLPKTMWTCPGNACKVPFSARHSSNDALLVE